MSLRIDDRLLRYCLAHVVIAWRGVDIEGLEVEPVLAFLLALGSLFFRRVVFVVDGDLQVAVLVQSGDQSGEQVWSRRSSFVWVLGAPPLEVLFRSTEMASESLAIRSEGIASVAWPSIHPPFSLALGLQEKGLLIWGETIAVDVDEGSALATHN